MVVEAAPRAAAAPQHVRRRRDRRPALLRLAVSVGAGVLLVLAFPPFDLWWLAPPAVAVFLVALRGRSAGAGALLGLGFGLGSFLPLLHWSGVYVGVVPWVLLALSQAAFLVGYGALAPTVWRLPAPWAWLAALWVADEWARGRVPFGGFPWGRLAFSQADAPTVALAALGGAPLVSFAVALSGALLAALVVAARTGRRRFAVVAAGAGAVAGVLAGLAVPLPTTGARTAVVAVVQGDVPRAGLEFNAERERVLRNHVDATESLAEQVRAGQVQQPDLVVWPENSSDIDPFTDTDARALIQQATDDVGVPVLVGAVVDGPGRYLSNTGVVWRPSTGPGQRYVKRHPAPFGEYIPLRSIARRISSKVDLVRRDFVAGTTVDTLPMGPADVADVICFEVAYDGLVRDVVNAGGDLLVVQTNNATFGYTGESEQQLAMSRLRAVEHGRTVLQASTVGVSAIVRPDGSVVDRTRLFTRDVMVAPVALRSSRTLADTVGAWPEAVLGGLGLIGALTALVLARRTRDDVEEEERG